MRCVVVKIGTVDSAYRALEKRFLDRLAGTVEVHTARSDAKALALIARLRLRRQVQLVTLDPGGVVLSSSEFTDVFGDSSRSVSPGLPLFVVGGPWGLPRQLREQAQHSVALGRATLPSDLAWIVLLEQVYRARSILAGSPYHHA